MTWWRQLLGVPEPGDAAKEPKAPPQPDSARAKQGEGAVEANKAFIKRNWDTYPECIQEYFKTKDQIEAYEAEIDRLDRTIRYTVEKMNELIELTKESRDVGFKLRGVDRVLYDYDSRMELAYARLSGMPDVTYLRRELLRLEQQAKDEGWIVWHGTGGVHWNKKGVLEDGYGVYERK